MIGRTFDPTLVNRFINDPDVRPFVGGDITTALDLTGAVQDQANIFLLGEHGGFAFIWSAPSTYEVHTFITPSGRGAWAASAALTARGLMATEHGADRLWTRVPSEAGNVRRFTTAAGFSPVGRQTRDFGAGPADFDLYEWRA